MISIRPTFTILALMAVSLSACDSGESPSEVAAPRVEQTRLANGHMRYKNGDVTTQVTPLPEGGHLIAFLSEDSKGRLLIQSVLKVGQGPNGSRQLFRMLNGVLYRMEMDPEGNFIRTRVGRPAKNDGVCGMRWSDYNTGPERPVTKNCDTSEGGDIELYMTCNFDCGGDGGAGGYSEDRCCSAERMRMNHAQMAYWASISTAPVCWLLGALSCVPTAVGVGILYDQMRMAEREYLNCWASKVNLPECRSIALRPEQEFNWLFLERRFA